MLIRRLFDVEQLTFVSDYVSRFMELVDQLVAYSNSTDLLYFTMRFVDGLLSDIKPMGCVGSASQRS